MGKITAVTWAGALAALLAVAACTSHSSERIVPAPPGRPSSPAAAGAACPDAVSVQGGPVPALDAVEFVSATRGWAAGSGGIVATTDGGRTWRRQYAGPVHPYELDFTDAEHGWAAGPAGLVSTSDGGRTWTVLPCPPPGSGPLDAVRFVTPRLGYAVAGARAVRTDAGSPVAVGGGRLLVSADGGRGWKPVAGAPSPAAQSACFTSASTGFLATPGRVWRTGDGGARWSVSFTEPPASSSSGGRLEPDPAALECAGRSAAWTLFLGSGAALGHRPYLACATADGRSWHVLFEETYTESGIRPGLRAPEGPGSYPGPFSAIGPGSAAYVGWTPAGLGTAPLTLVSDGQRRLARPGDVGGLTQAYAAAFLPSGRPGGLNGWVAGADQTSPDQPGRGVIEHTSDGGRTWTRQYASS